MNSDLARYLRRLAVFALVACEVSGCGRKGTLEPPPKADVNKTRASQAADKDVRTGSPSTDTTGQEAPAAEATPAASPTGGLSGFKAKKPPPIKPPKQSFFLDPLLQ